MKYWQNKNAIAVVTVILLAVGLLYGGSKALFESNNLYEGLVTEIDVEMDEEMREEIRQRVEEELLAIEEMKQTGEKDLSVYVNLAFDYHLLGNLVGARETYEHYLEENTLNTGVWSSYGSVLSLMGDSEGAVDAYAQAVDIGHMEGDYRALYRLLQEKLDRPDEAKQVVEDSLPHIGQRAWSMIALAQWYKNHGDCQRALAHYNVAESLAPESQSLQQEIAETKAFCKNQ